MVRMDFLTMMTKGSEFQWDHDSEFQWQEDAACRFQPYTLFEIASSGDAIAEGLNDSEIKDLNSANFERAGEICSTCPVFAECRDNATVEDFYFTFRAGRIPVGFNPNPKGRPLKGDAVASRPDGTAPCVTCGEFQWLLRKDRGHYYCGNCESIRRKAQRAGNKPERVRQAIDPEKPCKNGHLEWTERKDLPGHYYCRGCRRDRNREKKGITQPRNRAEVGIPCKNGHMDWRKQKASNQRGYRYYCGKCRQANRSATISP